MDTFQYETQALGFTPISFVDGVINAVTDYVFDGADQLRSALLREAVAFPEKDWVYKGMDSALEHVQSAIDKNFDKFELYVLKNIFHLPASTVLPWDEKALSLAKSTAEEEAAVDAEMAVLRAKCRKLRRVNAELRQESELLKPTIEKVEEASKMLETFAAASKKADVPIGTLSETFEHLCGHALELQAVLASAGQLSRKRHANSSASTKNVNALEAEFRAKRQRVDSAASRDLKVLLKIL